MKAKQIIPEQREQPKPLPAPSNKEREDQLAPWQKEVVALAEARLSLDEEQDVVSEMLRRAIGLCRIVEDMARSESESETSLEALATVMEVIEQDLYVAKWITTGRVQNPTWFEI